MATAKADLHVGGLKRDLESMNWQRGSTIEFKPEGDNKC